jgi:hypothetical protein
MSRPSLSLLAFTVALLGASNCIAQSDREARINEAIPLSFTAQSALAQMRRLVRDYELRATIEDELKTKMRLRALQCSQNFAIPPNASKEDIRREHGGDPCFAEQDASIADWLGLHSVGALLARTPLRPISSGIATIADNQASIQQVYFAAHAGVAHVLSYKDAEVLDLTRGVPILTALRSGYELINSISPNGRVYTANHGGRVRLYDAESGALLASPEGWYSGFGSGVHWLDGRTALVYSSISHGPSLYDFRTGESLPFDNDVTYVARIAEVSSAPSTYVAFRNDGITKFRLVYQDGQPRAEILQVYPIRLNLIPNDNGGAVAGGRYFVNTSSGQLYLTSMDDLRTAPVDLGALEVQRAVPTADADRIIVAGYVRGGPTTWNFYEYALREQTLRQISTNSLPSTRLEYDPTHNVLFAISGSDLQRVGELSVGEVIDPKSLMAKNGDAATTLPLPRHRFYALPPGAGIVTSHGVIQRFIPPAAAQPVPGPIADLAKDADIEGVGVYDADEPATARAGTIDVTVDARRAPLVLVLSSYASVRWRLSLKSGANLSAVLLTGPHGSSVEGQGKARVVAIGGAYSYVLGSPEYGLLQNEVYTWTGKRISLFQCGKHARGFSIY